MNRVTPKDHSNINSYVNGNDLTRYLGFLQFENPYIFRESEIQNIEDCFRGNNYLAVILINDTAASGIGHYVCLRKDGEGVWSYFDCLGDPPPVSLQEKFQGGPHRVSFLKKALMSHRNIICGKYCIAFALAGNISLDDFAEILSSGKKSADYIVNNLIRLNFTDNIL